jgi:lipopolysaccharide exporter
MSLARTAVRGAVWTMATSVGSRMVSLAATLMLTHLVSPSEYGEASAATVVVLSAGSFSSFFLANYLLAHREAGRKEAFHATFYNFLGALVAISVVLGFSNRIGIVFEVPHLARFAPLAAAAVLIDRVGTIPERVLLRQLRFRRVGIGRMCGEVTYGVTTMLTAALGWGGLAIIAGMIGRAIVRSGFFVLAINWREWAEPHAIERSTTMELFRFSTPIWIASMAVFAATNWDNLLISRYFGPALMAAYSLAYSLSDIAPTHIAEQLCEVLLPSFAKLSRTRRREALVVSTELVAFVTFPVAVGVGVIGGTMVRTFFDPRWLSAGPILAVLTVRSLARGVYYPMTQYFQSVNRTRTQMALSCTLVALLLIILVLLGPAHVLLSCAGVGVSYIVITGLGLFIVAGDGVPVGRLLRALTRIGIAVGLMSVAVIASRVGLDRILRPGLLLLVEIAVGALTYAGATMLFARPAAHEFVSFVNKGLGRLPVTQHEQTPPKRIANPV